MPLKIDSKDTNPDGAVGLGPGEYHVLVRDTPKLNDKGKFEVVFECVAGRTSEGDEVSCKGKSRREFFACEGKAASRLCQAAMALRWITYEQWKAAKDAGAMVDIPYENGKGSQCIIVVQMEESTSEDPKYKGKSFPQTGFRFFDVNDPKMTHVPKDPTFLGMAGGGLGGTTTTEDSPYGGF